MWNQSLPKSAPNHSLTLHSVTQWQVEAGYLVITLWPSPDVAANTISAGQLLCGGLFSGDSMSNWFAAVAMLHAVLGNTNQREQLLRVQLATSLGNPPVSLLQQCCNMLAQVGFYFILNLLCAGWQACNGPFLRIFVREVTKVADWDWKWGWVLPPR